MHNITNIDTLYCPNNEQFSKTWHGLQTITEEKEIAFDGSNVPDVFCPMVEGQLNPSFDGQGIELTEDMQSEMRKWKLICADLRDNDKSNQIIPVHIPKSGYQIHQNKDLFDNLIEACQEVLGNKFEIATIGTLGGYKSFIVSISIEGMETFTLDGNDKFNQFFNLISSHDGSLASCIMLSVVRIVCQNTAEFSIQQSEQNGTRERIKHTVNSDISPKWIEENLKSWINYTQVYKQTLQDIKKEKMDLQKFRYFSAGIFSDKTSDKLSSQSFNRINDLESLFVRGQGNKGETEFDAYNAFTEFFTSGRGNGNGEKRKRFAKASFGRGADWKREAFEALKNRQELPKLIKRGETLFNDKVQFEIAKSQLN